MERRRGLDDLDQRFGEIRLHRGRFEYGGSVGLENYPLYQYKPLDTARHIRLLRLYPPRRSERETIELTMISIDLTVKKNYQSLSYTWGDTYSDGSHLTNAVLVREDRNSVPRYKLPVTATLYAALKEIRRRMDFTPGAFADFERPKLLWADALCINQNDTTERNQQVAMMALIYQNAVRLNIWLGDTSALDLTVHPQWEEAHVPGVQSWRLVGESFDPVSVDHILKHKWFRRRWIIQEVLHTPPWRQQILIAGKEFSWPAFLSAMDGVQFDPVTTLPILAVARTVTYDQSTKKPLLYNLWRWYEAECQDPRDRLYALLSISKDVWSLKIDYGATIESVYSQLAHRIIDCNVVQRTSHISGFWGGRLLEAKRDSTVLQHKIDQVQS